jgi:hypothetical protein
MSPRRPKKVALIPMDHYEVRDAVNTIARAREHLGNPKMMKAVRAHVDSLNAAVTGGLKPKKPMPTKKVKGAPW